MDKQQLKVMFSSKSNDWATPPEFFEKLNWRFGPFDLDPCASSQNTKCANFYTEAENGLSKDWEGHIAFVNPPNAPVTSLCECCKWNIKCCSINTHFRSRCRYSATKHCNSSSKYWK